MWPIYPHTNTHMHDRTMHWDTLTAIECPYNTVEFVTILRWPWLNINEPLASHKDTYISTWRASHGVSIARIWEKIDCIRTISHDNIRTHENYDASPLQTHAHLADGVPKCAGVSILITDITWDGKKTGNSAWKGVVTSDTGYTTDAGQLNKLSRNKWVRPSNDIATNIQV